jgi:proteasome maturation protein
LYCFCSFYKQITKFKSLLQFAENRERMNMAILRNIQGLHAPLRLTMELQAAKKIGRLPFLPSSGFMSDVLTGRDEEIGFEDILNTAEFHEQMAQPHAVVEKHLALL